MAGKDWRTAYFRQARSDYEIFNLLKRENTPDCHRLHYLQMTTEKLAKGFRTRGDRPHPTTHKAFVKFLQYARVMPEFRHGFGVRHTESWLRYIDSFLDLAQTIENLAPTGEALNQPNPEYPWEQDSTVIAPIEYEFINLNFEAPKMSKLVKFVERCFILIETGQLS